MVAKVADLKPSDVVLEPSAGNGGLAVWPKAIGAEVHVNEIAPRRQEMLEFAGFGKPTAHDGEIINSLLDAKIQPTVILMNPPFSASTLKSYEAKNSNKYGFNHVDQALQRLTDGGRLVAILGGGQANEPNGGASLTQGGSREWFQKVAQRYNIRANMHAQRQGIPEVRHVVRDPNYCHRQRRPDAGCQELQRGRVPESIVQKNVDTLEEAYNALREVAGSRPQVQSGNLTQAESNRPVGAHSGTRVPQRSSCSRNRRRNSWSSTSRRITTRRS